MKLTNFIEHDFGEAVISDHAGGDEYHILCAYCGLEEGTKLNCLTKKKYEDIEKNKVKTRKILEEYWKKREQVDGRRRGVRGI